MAYKKRKKKKTGSKNPIVKMGQNAIKAIR